jgi:hypothetical protein
MTEERMQFVPGQFVRGYVNLTKNGVVFVGFKARLLRSFTRGMGWHGISTKGMGWHGMAWDGMGFSLEAWDGMGVSCMHVGEPAGHLGSLH